MARQAYFRAFRIPVGAVKDGFNETISLDSESLINRSFAPGVPMIFRLTRINTVD